MDRPQAHYGPLVARMMMPAVVVAALTLGALLVLLWLVASYQTSVAQAEQARLAENALTVRAEQIAKFARDYGSWDEAVAKLVDYPDPAWADENIGASTQASYGVDMSFVVTPDRRASYALVRGAYDERPIGEILTGGFETLLARQRALGSEGSTFGVILAEGRPAIAVLVPIRPQYVDRNDDVPRHMLVFVDEIDRAMADEFAHVYRLPGLQVEPVTVGGASVPLVTADGRRVASLTWDGARPGDRLLQIAVPAWALVALAFAILTTLFVRQTRSAARAISDSERRATHDALTGLPNRVLLFERLDRASRLLTLGGAGFAVAYLDLDGFKVVNDTSGHEAGDTVLREVARRLQAVLDPGDFAARIGGDEFAVILPDRRHPHEVLAIGRRVIAAIERPIDLDGSPPAHIGATIGVTFAPVDGADPITLLRNADQALYTGKRQTKGEVRFHTGSVGEKRTA